MSQAQVNDVDNGVPFHGLENGGVCGGESEPVPRREVDEAGELDDGEFMGVDGEVGLRSVHCGKQLETAAPGRTSDESSKKCAGEALVRVAVGGSNVVENPQDLLRQSSVVGLDRVGAVD